jgi:hypothetical protein
MGLYGEDAYSQQGASKITVMETIFKTWEDFGKPRLKFFKENIYSEIEASYLYHLLEEIITRNEETIIDDGLDGKELKEKRMERLYDFYCWNLKLIDTEIFYTSIKSLERYIYNTGIIMGKGKNSSMIRISLGKKKSDNLLNDLTPKFNIFKDKNKRQFYNGEELLDADDIIKGNLVICNEARKKAS